MSLRIHVYVCMHRCICLDMYVYVPMYDNMYMYVFVCMYMHTCVQMSLCILVCSHSLDARKRSTDSTAYLYVHENRTAILRREVRHEYGTHLVWQYSTVEGMLWHNRFFTVSPLYSIVPYAR